MKTPRAAVATAAGLVALTAVALAVAAVPSSTTVRTGAKVRVVRPTPSTVVAGNTVKTAVSISRFKLDCALAGTANRPGVGHYHIELDHVLVNMFCGRRARISMIGVRPGTHTLQLIP